MNPQFCDSQTIDNEVYPIDPTGGGGPGGGDEGDPAESEDSCEGSPIIITPRGNNLDLTSLQDGVRFDLNGDGFAEQMAWTRVSSDAGFLVLDRNANNQVDDGTELFGDYTFQPPSEEPNGFLALALFDEPANGGNGDGVISAEDVIYHFLWLWFDSSHDGVSQTEELKTLSEVGIESIDLRYRESRRQDQHGNSFRYTAKVRMEAGERPRTRFAIDVFFVVGN